jgi:hypothetical protein
LFPALLPAAPLVTPTCGEDPHLFIRDGASEDVRQHPKQDLVGTTSVVLAEGRLRIAAGMRAGDALISELLSYRRTTTEHDHVSYTAPPGQHDDLVIALSLALWLAENRQVRDTTLPASWVDRSEIEGIIEMGQGIITS